MASMIVVCGEGKPERRCETVAARYAQPQERICRQGTRAKRAGGRWVKKRW